MRNTIAVALSFVYLTLAVGVAKTTHYCMGRLNTTSLFTLQDKSCACALLAKEPKHSCCHDEKQLVKIEDDQSQSVITSVDHPDYVAIAIINDFFSSEQSSAYKESTASFFSDNSPPPPGVPLFTLNCSLVFYA